MKHWVLSLFLGLFLFEVFSVFPTRALPPPADDNLPYVSGLINVHTDFSDGSKKIPELASLARSVGHSFVVFSDHDSVEGRLQGLEGNYDGLDAFIELETSTPSGDLLLFFSHTSLANASVKELSKIAYSRFLGENKDSDIFLSISHPSHIKKPWTQLERFPDGLEIINFDSLFWRKLYSNPLDFLGLSLLYPLNPFISTLRSLQPYSKDMASWDNMNTLEPVHFGILSSQFKHKINFLGLNNTWPNYSDIFRLGSNIVFLKDKLSPAFSVRKKQIYQSIKEGRLATVFQAIHPFFGNDFYLKCGDSIYRSGSILKASLPSCEFIVKIPSNLPYSAKIRLLRNGELQKEISSTESEVHIPVSSVGQFRVEVYVRPHTAFWALLRKWIPYVIYNPIFITE